MRFPRDLSPPRRREDLKAEDEEQELTDESMSSEMDEVAEEEEELYLRGGSEERQDRRADVEEDEQAPLVFQDDGTLRRAAEATAAMNEWEQANANLPPAFVAVEPGSWGEPVGEPVDVVVRAAAGEPVEDTPLEGYTDEDTDEDDIDYGLSMPPQPMRPPVPGLNLGGGGGGGGGAPQQGERGKHHSEKEKQTKQKKAKRKGQSPGGGEEFDDVFDDSSASPSMPHASPSTDGSAADRLLMSKMGGSRSRARDPSEDKENIPRGGSDAIPARGTTRSKASVRADAAKQKASETLQRMRAIFTDLDKKKLHVQESKLRHGQQWSDGQGAALTWGTAPRLWGQERVIREAADERVRTTGKSSAAAVDYAGIADRMSEMAREMAERKEARVEARKQYEEDLKQHPGYHKTLASDITEARRDARLKVTERVAKKMQERCLSVHSSMLVESQRLTMEEFAPLRKDPFTPRALLKMTPRTREASREERLDYIRPKTPRTMGRYVAELDATKPNVFQMSRKEFVPAPTPLSFGQLKPTFPGKLGTGLGKMLDFPSEKLQGITSAVSSGNLRLLSSVYRFAGRVL